MLPQLEIENDALGVATEAGQTTTTKLQIVPLILKLTRLMAVSKGMG